MCKPYHSGSLHTITHALSLILSPSSPLSLSLSHKPFPGVHYDPQWQPRPGPPSCHGRASADGARNVARQDCCQRPPGVVVWVWKLWCVFVYFILNSSISQHSSLSQFLLYQRFSPPPTLALSPPLYTHTHKYTHIYIYTHTHQLACARIRSPEGQDYLKGMAAAANFAWVNRSMMTFLTRQVCV